MLAVRCIRATDETALLVRFLALLGPTVVVVTAVLLLPQATQMKQLEGLWLTCGRGRGTEHCSGPCAPQRNASDVDHSQFDLHPHDH